jgi:uncharacterized protein
MPKRRPGCSDARAATDLKDDNYLGKDPAATRVKHRPVDPALHCVFAAEIASLSPDRR